MDARTAMDLEAASHDRRLRGPHACSLLVTALATAGCGAGAGPDTSDAYTVRDSAGIRIVEADWDRLPVLDTVEAEPVFTVGDREDVALDDVGAARMLPGGRIAVGHGASPEVVVIDTASGEARTIATAGEGPAELGAVGSLHLEAGGEQLGVYDPGRQRYVVFDANGELVRERSLRDAWPGRGGVAVTMWAPPVFFPVGRDAFYIGAVAAPLETQGMDRAELSLLRVRGDRVDTVATYPGYQFYRDPQDAGPVLLGARVDFASAPDGVWIADTASPSAARWSSPGAPELIVRWNRDLDRTLTESDVRALVNRLTEQLPAPQRRMARQYLERPPVPEEYPAIGDLLTDDRGVLWVGEHHDVGFPRIRFIPEERRSWVLFDAEGTPLGRVVTPPRVDLLDVGSDWVLGLHQNELGVETVRLYTLDS